MGINNYVIVIESVSYKKNNPNFRDKDGFFIRTKVIGPFCTLDRKDKGLSFLSNHVNEIQMENPDCNVRYHFLYE